MKTNYYFLMKGFFGFLFFLMLSMVSIDANAQYCSAGPSSTADSNVDSVNIVGEGTSAIHFSGCPGVTGVQNLTATQSVNLNVGSTYVLKVKFGTCGGNYSGKGQIWIDWNKNNVFDANESIGTSSGTPGTAPWNASVSFSFTVPLVGMTNGPTRMRIMQYEGGSLPLSPCASFSWGSVMDFTVNIGGVYVPQTDLAVTSWNYPYSSCGMSSAESINITVKNTGTVTQSAYTLKYSVDNGTTWVSQAMTTPIMPDSTLNYTFATTANFSTVGTYNCLAAVVLPNDSATYNDTVTSTIIATAGMVIPYFDDLETWTIAQYGSNMGGDWTGSTTSNPRWEVEDASGTNENSSNTGPFYDHTNFGTSGGKYVYLETSGGSLGSTSYLTSPCINLSNQPGVLNFWYHMYGAAMGTLEVQQKVGGVWVSTGWSKTGQQQSSGSDPWLEATISLNPAADGVRFKGMRGSSYTSDICLDDIKLFIPMPNDLAMIEWTSPISGTTPSATMPITVSVFNAGTAMQDTFNLKYSIDGGTSYVTEAYNDSISAGDTLVHTFATTANMLTPGYYSVSAIVENAGDGASSNDTIYANPYLCTALAGAYSIGPDSLDDFATFSDAVFALNNCGVSGLVTINVDSGIYNEQVEIGEISGASATNRIIFVSANHDSTAVVLTNAGAGPVVYLNGADYVHFKNISIVGTGSATSAVQVHGGATYNVFEGNIFSGTNFLSVVSF